MEILGLGFACETWCPRLNRAILVIRSWRSVDVEKNSARSGTETLYPWISFSEDNPNMHSRSFCFDDIFCVLESRGLCAPELELLATSRFWHFPSNNSICSDWYLIAQKIVFVFRSCLFDLNCLFYVNQIMQSFFSWLIWILCFRWFYCVTYLRRFRLSIFLSMSFNLPGRTVVLLDCHTEKELTMGCKYRILLLW